GIFPAFASLIFISTATAQPPPREKAQTTRLQGTVVDDQGRPVADATVYCFMMTSQGTLRSMMSQADRQPAQKGVFWVDAPQGAGTTLNLRARNDKGVTEKALVVTGDKLKVPIKMTISPKFARPYRVRVTDPDGKAVAKAKIELKYATGGYEQFT